MVDSSCTIPFNFRLKAAVRDHHSTVPDGDVAVLVGPAFFLCFLQQVATSGDADCFAML
ncbi:MAG: hypothetical protein ACLTZT_13345 [Butyricimonas faecalis]